MKIIFLDMDGVLCTDKAHVAQGINGFHKPWEFMDALDREAIGMLNTLQAEHPEIQYVLSSTWRLHTTKEDMEKYLGSYGWKGVFHEDWCTDRDGPNRGHEVQRWVDSHNVTSDEYIILDDVEQFNEDQKPNLILTDEANGLSVRDYYRMKRMFSFGTRD